MMAEEEDAPFIWPEDDPNGPYEPQGGGAGGAAAAVGPQSGPWSTLRFEVPTNSQDAYHVAGHEFDNLEDLSQSFEGALRGMPEGPVDFVSNTPAAQRAEVARMRDREAEEDPEALPSRAHNRAYRGHPGYLFRMVRLLVDEERDADDDTRDLFYEDDTPNFDQFRVRDDEPPERAWRLWMAEAHELRLAAQKRYQAMWKIRRELEYMHGAPSGPNPDDYRSLGDERVDAYETAQERERARRRAMGAPDPPPAQPPSLLSRPRAAAAAPRYRPGVLGEEDDDDPADEEREPEPPAPRAKKAQPKKTGKGARQPYACSC